MASSYPISFGMAFADCGMPFMQIQDAVEASAFNAVQIPADALAHDDFLDMLSPFNGLKLVTGSIVEPSTARNLLPMKERMREDFVRHATELVERASRAGFSGVFLALSMDSILRSQELRDEALSLLRRLSPALLDAGVSLSLPFRAPSLPGGISPDDMASFLSDSMVPHLKVRLDIHPHELSKGFSPEALAGALRFELAEIAMHYDADAGNRLIKAHVAPWISPLLSSGFKGSMLFCPHTKEADRLLSEIDSLSLLCRELGNA